VIAYTTGNHLLVYDPVEDLLLRHLIGEEKEQTLVRAVLSLFLLVAKRLYGENGNGQEDRLKRAVKNSTLR